MYWLISLPYIRIRAYCGYAHIFIKQNKWFNLRREEVEKVFGSLFCKHSSLIISHCIQFEFAGGKNKGHEINWITYEEAHNKETCYISQLFVRTRRRGNKIKRIFPGSCSSSFFFPLHILFYAGFTHSQPVKHVLLIMLLLLLLFRYPMGWKYMMELGIRWDMDACIHVQCFVFEKISSFLPYHTSFICIVPVAFRW